MLLSGRSQQLPLTFSDGQGEDNLGQPGGSQQLPLAFNRCDVYDFESYIPGINKNAVDYLLNAAKGYGDKNIYIWGEEGAGKSHLLQAVCNSVAETGQPCVYLPLTQISDFTLEMFSSLEELSLVCMDDMDEIAGKEDWEAAAFNLFNRLREAQTPLIMSSRRSPNGSLIRLPDLKSRLSWDLTFRLQPMDEAIKIAALKRRAETRGFELTDGVVEYLIKRVSRDAHNLFRWLDRLDKHSLIAQKKLTVPFVKQILEESE